ncbi:MAG: helix-turn-helix transcriptional regulator [Novosphingobium sp.]|nr:helix-turn-helix transcriptional regulator [Novosphingobium sp.]
MARTSGKNAETPILKRLGDAVRARRKELALSQEALADLAGVDRSHMGKIERGERNVTLLNIERIASALKTTPSALLGSAGY